MNRWIVIVGCVVGSVVVGAGLGFGAIKLYQAAGPVKQTHQADKHSAATASVGDPVTKIRQLCKVSVDLPASKIYGDVTRQLPGASRQTTTFTATASVIQTDPVVLDVDTASVQSKDTWLFDENMKQLPTTQMTVADSAVEDLHFGDIITASIEYSRPAPGEGLVNPTDDELATVVRLQSATVVTDTTKQGIFAKNFTLFALPAPTGMIHMANGDTYSYGVSTETSSGIYDVKHSISNDTASLASKLATMDVYAAPGSATTQFPAVFCGRADTSTGPVSEHDSKIMADIFAEKA